MTRREYFNQLKSELKKMDVEDIEDILSEYEQHFAFKLSDGHTEEEVAAKLGAPQEIAAQYVLEKGDVTGKPEDSWTVRIGLFFASIGEGAGYLLLAGLVTLLAASALAFAVLGILLISDIDIAQIIPPMPYSGAVLLGVSCLGLALVLALCVYRLVMQVGQMIKASIRWHKRMLSGAQYPPLPWGYHLSGTKANVFKRTMQVSIVVFVIFFTIGYAVLATKAGALGFWHVWNWFVR